MNNSHIQRTTFAGLLLFAAASIPTLPAQASGQAKSPVLGTWVPVSVVNTAADGQKVDVFGATPIGRVIFAPNGQFTVLFSRTDLPKFASGNRVSGTAEENQAVVKGTLAYSGSYSVDSKEKALVMKVDASSFPAWIGETQKRKYILSGDNLQWEGVVGNQGGKIVVNLKREK